MQTKFQRMDLENKRNLSVSQIFRNISWEHAIFLRFLQSKLRALHQKKKKIKC